MIFDITTHKVQQWKPILQKSMLSHSSRSQVSYLQPPKLQISYGRKMSSDQSEIKFEDADLYERFMGVWSQILGSQFIDWMSPAKGQLISECLFDFLNFPKNQREI